MNADPLELQKFSELAHHWWDPTSEFKPLHEINPLRLEWINARAPLAGKNVIDIGCGGGILSESMARKGAKVTGIDLSEKALKVADLHSLESGVQVRYKLIAAEDMAAQASPAVSMWSPVWKCWNTCPTQAPSCAPPPPW
jgi:2-polyprenyl-6-hydroxyphenyl methylase/3-demethylubiquinone-9 3-methyltransferase